MSVFVDHLRAEYEALEPYALAIGRLCIQWAQLELHVNQLFGALLQGPDNLADEAMVQCIDFRDQLSAIRVGALAKGKTEWAEMVISTVDYIDNTLRPRRNRYVHDRWMHTGKEVVRVDPTPKMYREAGSGERRWSRISISPDAHTEITETTDQVFEHLCFVASLTCHFKWGEDDPTIEELRAARPPQRLLLPPQGTRHR